MNQWIKRGKIIKQARENKGLKQEDIANMLQKSISTISSYESGKKIDFDNLKKLCVVLDLNLMEFSISLISLEGEIKIHIRRNERGEGSLQRRRSS